MTLYRETLTYLSLTHPLTPPLTRPLPISFSPLTTRSFNQTFPIPYFYTLELNLIDICLVVINIFGGNYCQSRHRQLQGLGGLN